VLNAELAKQGIEVNNNLCEHFAYSRQELFHLIRVEGIKTFDELLAKHGQGYGCEVCNRPSALCWPPAGMSTSSSRSTRRCRTPTTTSSPTSRKTAPSVIPRSAGGEITPEGLVAVGRIAREFNLYTKITGSQRIGLFGAQKDDLPESGVS
jgi:nitrite reductase (NADH) large subunit